MWLDWSVFCDCGFHSICPLMDKDKRLMEASWWERLTRVLFWWAEPCSVNLQSNFLFMGRAVPSLLFALRPNYGRDNDCNYFKRTCVHTAVFSAHDPVAGHCWPISPPETPGHLQASIAQSLVETLLLSPGSWYAQGFICPLQESVSPVLWKFCNQIWLA